MSVINGTKQDAGETLVWTTTLGSATDTIDVPAASLGGTRYDIEMYVVPGAVGGGAVNIYANSDTTDGNYTNQYMNADDPTFDQGRQAQPVVGGITNGTGVWFAKLEVFSKLGTFGYRAVTHRVTATTTSANQNHLCFNHTTTINTITDLRLYGTVANAFGVGTIINVLRPHKG